MKRFRQRLRGRAGGRSQTSEKAPNRRKLPLQSTLHALLKARDWNGAKNFLATSEGLKEVDNGLFDGISFSSVSALSVVVEFHPAHTPPPLDLVQMINERRQRILHDNQKILITLARCVSWRYQFLALEERERTQYFSAPSPSSEALVVYGDTSDNDNDDKGIGILKYLACEAPQHLRRKVQSSDDVPTFDLLTDLLNDANTDCVAVPPEIVLFLCSTEPSFVDQSYGKTALQPIDRVVRGFDDVKNPTLSQWRVASFYLLAKGRLFYEQLSRIGGGEPDLDSILSLETMDPEEKENMFDTVIESARTREQKNTALFAIECATLHNGIPRQRYQRILDELQPQPPNRAITKHLSHQQGKSPWALERDIASIQGQDLNPFLPTQSLPPKLPARRQQQQELLARAHEALLPSNQEEDELDRGYSNSVILKATEL